MQVNSTIRVATALYDFNVLGGAINTYNLGVYFPVGALPLRYWYWRYIPFAGGVGASVRLSLSNNTSNPFITTSIAGFNIFGTALLGASTGKLVADTGAYMQFEIFGNTLTAGKFLFSVEYLDQNVTA